MVKDWRGTELKVGSIIVYPVRQSSSMWVNEATVISFEEIKPETTRTWETEGKQHSYTNPAEVNLTVELTGRMTGGTYSKDEPKRITKLSVGRWTIVG